MGNVFSLHVPQLNQYLVIRLCDVGLVLSDLDLHNHVLGICGQVRGLWEFCLCGFRTLLRAPSLPEFHPTDCRILHRLYRHSKASSQKPDQQCAVLKTA